MRGERFEQYTTKHKILQKLIKTSFPMQGKVTKSKG
jgi:hypothetical protein